MGTKLSKDELQRIREIKIHRVLGIVEDSRRRMIRCPFHNERKPSFVLYPDGGWHCYGCGKHGNNAIDFVMAMGCGFVEALTELTKYV